MVNSRHVNTIVQIETRDHSLVLSSLSILVSLHFSQCRCSGICSGNLCMALETEEGVRMGSLYQSFIAIAIVCVKLYGRCKD